MTLCRASRALRTASGSLLAKSRGWHPSHQHAVNSDPAGSWGDPETRSGVSTDAGPWEESCMGGAAWSGIWEEGEVWGDCVQMLSERLRPAEFEGLQRRSPGEPRCSGTCLVLCTPMSHEPKPACLSASTHTGSSLQLGDKGTAEKACPYQDASRNAPSEVDGWPCAVQCLSLSRRAETPMVILKHSLGGCLGGNSRALMFAQGSCAACGTQVLPSAAYAHQSHMQKAPEVITTGTPRPGASISKGPMPSIPPSGIRP